MDSSMNLQQFNPVMPWPTDWYSEICVQTNMSDITTLRQKQNGTVVLKSLSNGAVLYIRTAQGSIRDGAPVEYYLKFAELRVQGRKWPINLMNKFRYHAKNGRGIINDYHSVVQTMIDAVNSVMNSQAI